MATAAAPAPSVVVDPVAATGAGPKLILIFAVAGLVLGGGLGGFVIAPQLGAAAESAVEQPPKPEPRAPAVIHQVENLVLNPANTNGGRFLLVTASIVVRDDGALAELTERDAEIRDRIVGLLSARSIEYLGDPTNRDLLKADLAAAIGALFEEGVVRRVLLPQFVIQ